MKVRLKFKSINTKNILEKEVERYKYLAEAREREIVKLKTLLEARDLQLDGAEANIKALFLKLGGKDIVLTKADIKEAMKHNVRVVPNLEDESFTINMEKVTE